MNEVIEVFVLADEFLVIASNQFDIVIRDLV